MMFQTIKKLSVVGVISSGLLLSACVTESLDGNQPTVLRGQTKKERENEAIRVKTQLAIAYMEGGNYRLATQTIEAALKENDKYDMAWLTRAQIYQYLKTYDKADESFQRALKLSPNGAEINNNYGWFLCDIMKKPNDSIPYFDKAIADPTYPTPEIAYFNKGICHTRMQQYNLANSYFERAMQNNPNFIPALKEWARSQMMAGDLKEADRLLRQYQNRINALNADDLLLGWRLARLRGETHEASEYQAQLVQNFPYSDELRAIKDGDYASEAGETTTDNDDSSDSSTLTPISKESK